MISADMAGSGFLVHNFYIHEGSWAGAQSPSEKKKIPWQYPTTKIVCGISFETFASIIVRPINHFHMRIGRVSYVGG